MATEVQKEILHDYSPMIKIYKDGTVERLMGLDFIPPTVDPETGVQSKDVVISEDPAVSARVYLPGNTQSGGKKLPVFVYYHGGGFFVESAFSANYHTHLTAVAAVANVIAVSVEYRLAPEHLIPAAYDDSWEALKWVASHSGGSGPEPWLNEHADLIRVFLAGDSAGGNLAHNIALKAGMETQKLSLDIVGIFLNCPYFWGKDPIGAEIGSPAKGFVDSMWEFVHPAAVNGVDDPLMNVVKEPRLAELGCKRVLVYVAEKDLLRDRGYQYGEELQKIGWGGEVEVVEADGVGHVFNLFDPKGDKSVAMLKKLVSFINV